MEVMETTWLRIVGKIIEKMVCNPLIAGYRNFLTTALTEQLIAHTAYQKFFLIHGFHKAVGPNKIVFVRMDISFVHGNTLAMNILVQLSNRKYSYNMFFWTPQKPERNGRTKFTGSCGVALGSIIIVKPLRI